VHGDKAIAGIENFLSEPSRSFGRINLFDVTRAATGATCKFTFGNSSQCLNFRSFCARKAIAR